MARRRNPARLVIALSVAAVLADLPVYTSFAGGVDAERSSRASSPARAARVLLGGMVVNAVTGDARGEGLRFTLAT